MQLMRKRPYLAQDVGIEGSRGVKQKKSQNSLISNKHRISSLLRTLRILTWQMLSY
jgi:hypothetical protein